MRRKKAIITATKIRAAIRNDRTLQAWGTITYMQPRALAQIARVAAAEARRIMRKQYVVFHG